MFRTVLSFSTLTLFLLSYNDISAQAGKIKVDGGLHVSGGFLIGTKSGIAQNFNMANGVTLTDSSGYLYDSGGPSGNYNPGEDQLMRIDIPGAELIRLTVEMMDLEDPYDVLTIIDDSTNSTLATLTGNMMTIIEAEHGVRCEFSSNPTVNMSGWQIRWDGMFLNPADSSSGPAGRLEYIAARNALRSGYVAADEWDIDRVGRQSFATGRNTQASGDNSVAHGMETIAQAYAAMAIGQYNVGTGNPDAWDEDDPVLEVGVGTDENNRKNALTILKNGRIGIGINPKVTFHIGDGQRVLWGTDTLGNGDKLMFLPDLHAFRVGTVATGAASTYWNRDSIGLYSFASGRNTRAQGFGATAMGRDTEATNSYAFASGFFTNADGQYSTAMGFNTDALALGSTALGYSTDAEKNYSFAAGYFAEAQAIYSVAIGNAVRAQSYSSTAVGRYNVGGGSATSWLTSDPIFEIGIGTGPSTRANAMTVRKNGNVGIGTTVPLDKLHVNGRIRMTTVEYFEDGGTSEIAARGDIRPSSNNIYDLGTSTYRWDDVYATNGTINTSDARDKKNIQALNYGLSEVLQLAPKRYEWKENPGQGEKLGLLAQDVMQILPEVVKTHDYVVSEEDESLSLEELDRYGMYYSDLIPVLINAIQELATQVGAQEQLIELLEQRIAVLEQE